MSSDNQKLEKILQNLYLAHNQYCEANTKRNGLKGELVDFCRQLEKKKLRVKVGGDTVITYEEYNNYGSISLAKLREYLSGYFHDNEKVEGFMEYVKKTRQDNVKKLDRVKFEKK